MNAPEYPRLEPQRISTEVLIEKYAKNGETTLDEVRSRVARALAQVEPEGERGALEVRFLWALRNGFVPAGRINSAAGTDIRATLINCSSGPCSDTCKTEGFRSRIETPRGCFLVSEGARDVDAREAGRTCGALPSHGRRCQGSGR